MGRKSIELLYNRLKTVGAQSARRRKKKLSESLQRFIFNVGALVCNSKLRDCHLKNCGPQLCDIYQQGGIIIFIDLKNCDDEFLMRRIFWIIHVIFLNACKNYDVLVIILFYNLSLSFFLLASSYIPIKGLDLVVNTSSAHTREMVIAAI